MITARRLRKYIGKQVSFQWPDGSNDDVYIIAVTANEVEFSRNVDGVGGFFASSFMHPNDIWRMNVTEQR